MQFFGAVRLVRREWQVPRPCLRGLGVGEAGRGSGKMSQLLPGSDAEPSLAIVWEKAVMITCHLKNVLTLTPNGVTYQHPEVDVHAENTGSLSLPQFCVLVGHPGPKQPGSGAREGPQPWGCPDAPRRLSPSTSLPSLNCDQRQLTEVLTELTGLSTFTYQ